MPVHIKLMVSGLTLAAGIGYYFFEKAIGDPQLAYVGVGLSIFMVVAMWVFPETGNKK